MKVKMKNCEKVFNHKQLLLDDLKQIEMMIHNQYAVVQNDDIEINLAHLYESELSSDLINDRIEAFRKKWVIHVNAINDHITKCHLNE